MDTYCSQSEIINNKNIKIILPSVLYKSLRHYNMKKIEKN